MADELPSSSPTSETPPPRTTGGNWRWEPPTAAELQNLMPGYTIEKILGRGGMGAVYRGVQTNLDRPVAIKILPPGVEKEDPSFAERFKSEARLMAKLNHPAVVAVYDFGTTAAGQLYFAMEYVDGSDVSQMISAQGRLPPDHALAITAHVCDALSAAHELGIVHRDIKPANVLLNMKGQVKVADFGLAKVEDPGQHGLTKTGYAMGTPDFVAPEALMLGTAVDGRADLYAVGVMLYQMLTGNIPRGAFKPASVLVPGLDPRFDPIILKAMQHDREERHQSAAELRRELDVILTVPFVRNDAPVSAAIPVAQMAQAPGQRSAAQKPQQPRSAGAPTRQPSVKAGEGTRAPETSPKSKTPLFIGMVAAAAVGIGAFVMFSGGKKTPLAAGSVSAPPSKPVSVASSTPKPAASTPKPATASTPSVSKSPPLPVAASSDKFPPGQWVKVFTKEDDLPEELRKPDSGVKFEDGWLRFDRNSAARARIDLRNASLLKRNYAVRVRCLRSVPVGMHAAIVIRRQPGQEQHYQLSFHKSDFLNCNRRSNGEYTELFTFDTPIVRPGSEYSIEFGAVGDWIVGRYDNKTVKMTKDSSWRQGDAYVSGADDIRDIEVINLDGLSEAEALKILGVDEKGNDLRKPAAVAATPPAVSKFPPGQWVKVFNKLEDLPESLRKPDSGVSWKEGRLTASKNISWRLPAVPSMRNGGIRFTATKESKFELRIRDYGSQFYALRHVRTLIRALTQAGGMKHADLAASRSARLSNDEAVYEIAAVGNRVLARFDSELIGPSLDDSIRDGHPAFANLLGTVYDIEVINLDGLPEAEALRLLGVDEKGNDLRALAAKQEQQMAEQAKEVDAMAAIPELKALHEQFVKLQAERVTAPFEAEVAKLNAGYIGGIDRKIAQEKAAGHLDGIIALEAEKKLLADKQPIPADDAEGTTANLKALRGIYRAAYTKIEAARAENLKALTDPLSVRLKQLEADLTKKDRVPDAKTVREYREKLSEGGAVVPSGAAQPDRTSTNGGAAAKMNEAEKSLRAPLKKFPPGDDRKAAEWALDLGGTITIRDANGDQKIQAKGSLPKRPFDLVGVNLAAPDRAKRQVIEYAGLLPLAGLQNLNNVALSDLPVTDDDSEVLATLPELNRLQLTNAPQFTGKKLALLKETTKLTWMNIGGNGITPEGIDQVTQLTNLTGLQLNKTYLEDKDVAPLLRLKKLNMLSLNDTKVTPEGWKQLKSLSLTELAGYFTRGTAGEWCTGMAAAFPDVNRLEFSAREAVTPEDVAAVAAFRELSTLILATTYMDDATVGALAGLSKLENLTLRAGTAGPVKTVTDASADSLQALKKLLKLRLEKIDSFTPAALMKLTKLKSLRTLEIVTCQQLDDTAIAAFKKERPDVTVTR